MITVALLTRNDERRIGRTLESLEWADEVLLIDTGSTDHTVEIAATFPNVKVHHEPFSGYGQLRQKGARLASHDWIFSIESDEVMSEALAVELQELTKDPACVYSVPRQNYFNNKWIKCCGWHPDRQVRLSHRSHSAKQQVALEGPLLHYPFTSIAEMIDKIQYDSDLFAIEYHHRKKGSILRAHLLGFWHFWKHYLFKGGLFAGAEGYIICRYLGHRALYKMLKLRQVNLDLPPMGEPPYYDADV
ncbi:MAG: glycosyltransferase family 2 protein [Parachlamydiales bacterium]